MHKRSLTRIGAFMAFATAAVAFACGPSLPIPERTQARTETYVPVPLPPPPPRPEHVPDKPTSDAVWIDGEWNWDGSRYRWAKGAWVELPPGAKFAPWTTVRRDDGQLFFTASTWYDEGGRPIPSPKVLAEGYVREPDAGSEAGLPEAGVQDATNAREVAP